MEEFGSLQVRVLQTQPKTLQFRARTGLLQVLPLTKEAPAEAHSPGLLPGHGGLCPSLMTGGSSAVGGVPFFLAGTPPPMTKSKRLPEHTRKSDPSELARLVRENAEALFKDLAGEDFHRAFNPDRPPRRKVVLTFDRKS